MEKRPEVVFLSSAGTAAKYNCWEVQKDTMLIFSCRSLSYFFFFLFTCSYCVKSILSLASYLCIFKTVLLGTWRKRINKPESGFLYPGLTLLYCMTFWTVTWSALYLVLFHQIKYGNENDKLETVKCRVEYSLNLGTPLSLKEDMSYSVFTLEFTTIGIGTVWCYSFKIILCCCFLVVQQKMHICGKRQICKYGRPWPHRVPAGMLFALTIVLSRQGQSLRQV